MCWESAWAQLCCVDGHRCLGTGLAGNKTWSKEQISWPEGVAEPLTSTVVPVGDASSALVRGLSGTGGRQ